MKNSIEIKSLIRIFDLNNEITLNAHNKQAMCTDFIIILLSIKIRNY